MTLTATRRSTLPARPKLTSAEATRFDRFSVASALQIGEAIAARAAEGVHSSCSCQPYEDVFTFNRWIAQGRAVCKGEKALKIASFVPAASGYALDEDGSRRMYPKTLCLFCRCQTKSVEAANGTEGAINAQN